MTGPDEKGVGVRGLSVCGGGGVHGLCFLRRANGQSRDLS
jgi:hypothetical protein